MMRSVRVALGVCGLCAGAAWAQRYPLMSEAETNALAEIRAQQGAGLIAVQPWVQVMGAGRLGVGWLTAQEADGVAEWTQSDGADAAWR